MKNSEKKQILFLIKQELIHARLLNGLNDLGLIADRYSLELNRVILPLMGYKTDDEKRLKIIYKFERKLRFSTTKIFFKNINEQARKLYRKLKKD